MDFDKSEIQDAIVKSLKDIDIPFKVSDEIAFHMTDWLSDLSQWEQFCKNPKAFSSDEEKGSGLAITHFCFLCTSNQSGFF